MIVNVSLIRIHAIGINSLKLIDNLVKCINHVVEFRFSNEIARPRTFFFALRDLQNGCYVDLLSSLVK